MNLKSVVALSLPALLLTVSVSAQQIPDNPEKLSFAPLSYAPPSAKDHRVVLKNGVVAYLVEDRALPLVNIQVTVGAGVWLEPAGKAGLARLTGAQMRAGGTKFLSAEQFDERADFLAAQIGSSMGDTSAGASLNCLADNLDDSLKIFLEMLRSPGFQEDRLKLAKDQILQDLKKRNDESSDIEGRELGVLIYGEEHLTNHFSTEASITSITRDDLAAFHDMYYYPANMILAVSGSFTKADMVKKLDAAFALWPSPKRVVGAIPQGIKPAAPGLYRVDKDVNQGRVSVVIPTVMRTSPDIYALEVMNEILGGSGFTSRITKTVRSNEGLAYSAGSGIGFGTYFPGRFRAAYQSKSSTVAYALQLVFEEIGKIRDTKVTDEELLTIKNNLIQTFPSIFESKAQQAGTFAADEYTKRDPLFWSTYRDKIQAVTAA
ncbi:MAG: insulinase family protein, partial [Vicinamibacteria bacterium]|nr:insulinase family protein [Vicinamibacteria bacterium]